MYTNICLIEGSNWSIGTHTLALQLCDLEYRCSDVSNGEQGKARNQTACREYKIHQACTNLQASINMHVHCMFLRHDDLQEQQATQRCCIHIYTGSIDTKLGFLLRSKHTDMPSAPPLKARVAEVIA